MLNISEFFSYVLNISEFFSYVLNIFLHFPLNCLTTHKPAEYFCTTPGLVYSPPAKPEMWPLTFLVGGGQTNASCKQQLIVVLV